MTGGVLRLDSTGGGVERRQRAWKAALQPVRELDAQSNWGLWRASHGEPRTAGAEDEGIRRNRQAGDVMAHLSTVQTGPLYASPPWSGACDPAASAPLRGHPMWRVETLVNHKERRLADVKETMGWRDGRNAPVAALAGDCQSHAVYQFL